MTTVTFFSEGDRLCAFETRGHSGRAPQGEDILCAAITSAVRLTECAINDVLGLAAGVKQREQEAFLSVKLPGGLGAQNESTCQTLLTALMLYCTELHEEYPEHIIVFNTEV